MKKTFVTSMIAVALFFLLPALVWAAVVGEFTFVKGRIDLSRAGRPAVIVRLGDKVEAGDVIRSKSKSVAEVTFVNKNIMRISSGSKVALTQYTIGDTPSAIINLSRGKVQNIVNKAGLALSRLRKRKFEVHTPTMVVGVRGTNFLTSYRFGVSFASFKRGYGYGFNKRRPNQVFNILTGQLMEVSSPTAVPVVRKATPAELSSPELEQAGLDKSKEGGDTAGKKNGKGGEKKTDKNNNENGGKPEKAVKSNGNNGGKSGKAARSEGGNAVVGDIAGDYAAAPAVEAPVARKNVGTADRSKTTVSFITDSQDDIAAVAAVVKKNPALTSTDSADALIALASDPDGIKAALAAAYNPVLDPNSPQYNPVLDPNSPQYNPVLDPNSPSYDPTLDPNSPQYNPVLDPNSPQYNPVLDPNSPQYNPVLDPNSPSYDPTLDPNNPNYNPPPAPTPYAANSSFAWVPGIGHHGELWRSDGSNKRRFEYDYFQVSASADIAAGTIPFGSRTYEYNDGINKNKSMMYLPFGEEWYVMDFGPGDFSPVASSSPWDAAGSNDPNVFTTPPAGAAWSGLAGSFSLGDYYNTNAIVKSGVVSVSMGALAAVADASGAQNPVTFTGTYAPADNNYSRRVLVDLSLQSPAGSPVGYEGFLAGILDSSTLNTALIYVDPAGRAGTLTGMVDAAASPAADWSTTAALSGTWQSDVVSFSPAQLGANLASGLMYADLDAYAYNSTSGSYDDVIKGEGYGRTLNIKGLDWGIFRLLFGYDAVSNISSSSPSYWDAAISGVGEFGSHVTNAGQQPDFGIWRAWLYSSGTNSGTNNGNFGSSSLSGWFITPSNSGWLDGGMSAAYDITSTANGAWMGAAAGEWHKDSDFMFNGILNGTAHSHAESIKSYRQTNYGRTAITDGSVSMYEYTAVRGENRGTSWYYNNTDNTITRRDYHPDNTYEDVIFTPAGGFTYGVNGFLGNYSASGSYSRSAPQSYTGTALSNLSSLPAGLTSWDTQTVRSGFNDIGSIQDGLLGGTYQDLLAAGTTQANPAMFAGLVDTDIGNGDGGGLYVAGINSYNPYDGSYTIMNPADNSHNGSYWGYMTMSSINNQDYYYSGFGDEESSGFIGFIGGLYIDKDGNAGVVKGNFNTYNYGYGGGADIDGKMFPVALIPVSFTAAALDQNTLFPSWQTNGIIDEQHYTAGGHAFTGVITDVQSLFGTASASSVVANTTYRASNVDIGTISGLSTAAPAGTGKEWLLSTWAVSSGGTMDTPLDAVGYWLQPFDENLNHAEHSGAEQGFWERPNGATGIISGQLAAGWANENYAVAGLSFGDLQGTFDNNNLTWQTVAQGVAIDVNTYLYLVHNHPSSLIDLRLPAIEVGSTDLSGSDNNLHVTMHNLVFYTGIAAGPPQAWVTDDISGYYASLPTATEVVHLAAVGGSSSGPTADFTVNTWTAGGNWEASITSGTGSLATAPAYQSAGGISLMSGLQFAGVATGKDNGAGSFNGTGAGYASSLNHQGPLIAASSTTYASGSTFAWVPTTHSSGDFWRLDNNGHKRRFAYDYSLVASGAFTAAGDIAAGFTRYEYNDGVNDNKTVMYLPFGEKWETTDSGSADFSPVMTTSPWPAATSSVTTSFTDPGDGTTLSAWTPMSTTTGGNPATTNSTSNVVVNNGAITASMASLSAVADYYHPYLYDANSVIFTGTYTPADNNYSRKALVDLGLQSPANAATGYSGFLAGILDSPSLNAALIYVDSAGQTGTLTGMVDAAASSAVKWATTATLSDTWHADVVSFSPGQLDANLDSGFMSADLDADAYNSTSGPYNDVIKGAGAGRTLNIKGLDWGIFRLLFGYDAVSNIASSSSPSYWDAAISGKGEFGSHVTNAGPQPDFGLWQVDSPLNGSGTAGVAGYLGGAFSGQFLTPSNAGGLNGFLSAAGDVSGTTNGAWMGAATGEWHKNKLTFNGVLNGAAHSHAEAITSYAADIGSFQAGMLGGIDQDLLYSATTQTHPASFSGLLEVDIWGGGVGAGSVYIAGVNSYNPYDGTSTIMNPADNSHNGSYWGYMAMNMTPGSIGGYVGGLYIDKDGNAGVVTGDISANTGWADTGWAVNGSMYPVRLIPASFSTATLSQDTLFPDSITNGIVKEQSYAASNPAFVGSITGGPGNASVAADLYISTIGGTSTVTSAVTGSPWTWRIAAWADSMDGTLSASISNQMAAQQVFQEEWPGYIRMGTLTGTWDPATGNITDGRTAAGWVNINDAVAGLSFGDLQGTFANSNLTWQTIGQGVSMDVNTYLYLVRNNPNALMALNIPSFEVGSATLTGNNGNLNVNMNNVVFYTSTATGTPQVWATNDIAGHYTTTPAADDVVALATPNGGNNLMASFVVHNWAAGGNWAATVQSGGGTLATSANYQASGGSATLSNLQFGGVAAGKDSSGTFTGTGAGYAH